MPKQLIAPGAPGVAVSEAFTVNPAEAPRGFSATGLSGAETITLSRDDGGGVFVLMTDASAILTVSSPRSSVVASGRYRLERSAGSAGGYID